MLKKLLKKSSVDQENNIFPNPLPVKDKTVHELSVNSVTNDNWPNLAPNLDNLVNNEEFLNKLVKCMLPQLLLNLEQKYGFEPTDKHRADVENRKKYINQLDAYLEERKQINQAVENELQQFLSTTTHNLTQALESFSSSISRQIRDAETKHGIAAVKEILLKDNSPDQGL